MQAFEINDSKRFNRFLLKRNASVLQSWEWGEFQKRLNRKVWRLLLTTNTGKELAGATMLKMPLAQNKSFFYCPRGPVVAEGVNVAKVWELFLDKISDLVALEKPVFLRVDPEVVDFPGDFSLTNLRFKKLSFEIQPKDTLVLDLTKNEDELVNRMKPKTRYNIHLAEKKGVVIEQYSNPAGIKPFWQLLKETEVRDTFSGHPFSYYSNLMESLGKAGRASVFLAYYHNRPLAAALICTFGKTAIYLHGASGDRLRNIMAPYLVQWAAIKWAKVSGLKSYDFGGIAPASAKAGHSWSGLTRFKKGFGGYEISYIGAYDLAYSEFWYRLYLLARKINRGI